jgi:hypothetical protein
MTRKVWILIAVAVLLGGFSLYLNQDLFSKENIHVYHRSRPYRAALFRRKRPDDSPIDPIVFGFNRKYRLTSLKIIPVSDIETNKYPQPVWHLVSESNSVPIKDFMYGMAIAGMHPAIKGAAPDPLVAGGKYRLFVEAGPLKAQHDFETVPRTQ